MRRRIYLLMALCVGLLGCGLSVPEPTGGGLVDTRYVAMTEPAGALPVGLVRQSGVMDQTVTLEGVVGGTPYPFIEGLAAFTIVDPSVPFCRPAEGCPTPWDYCCAQDQVRQNIATVKVVDDSGRPVTVDARELLGIKGLSSVVVQGDIQRDDHGNLTVVTNKVFVRPSE